MPAFPLVAASFFLAGVVIHWDKDAVELRGVPSSLSIEQISKKFIVTVDGQSTSIMGNYSVTAPGVVTFRPRFPMQPGLTYKAEWTGAPPSSSTFSLPKVQRAKTAVVERIYPSTDVLPSNILKLYVQFNASMSRGEAWRRIHLIDDAGKEVSLPFLEIEQELWDQDTRRLTVLFDPGRIKRGLVPHNEVGPALIEGRKYKIVIDSDWQDANGTPMAAAFTKEFLCGPEDRTPPSLSNWKLTSPRKNQGSLTITFPEPLDSALLQRLIHVRDSHGTEVEGTVEVSINETRWSFTPDQPWKSGQYKLAVGAILEDLAGNRIDRPFDVDTFQRVEMRNVIPIREMPFIVQLSAEPR